MKRMFQPIALIALLSLAFAPAAAAQENAPAAAPAPEQAPSPGFSLSGGVGFPKKGDIYIRVITREEFEKDENGDIKARIKPTAEEEKAGAVGFAFADVPEGAYAIQVFQDVNGNGKMDTGFFGPKEPWGTYRHARPKFRAPKWEEMAFDVDGDLEGIKISIK